MGSSNKNSNNFIKQGSILAIAGILCRLIGLAYRIPLNNIIGDAGNGIYGIAYNVYNLFLILSSYSMPLAVSKLVSSRCIKGEHRNSNKVFRCSLILSMLSGGFCTLILFFGADFIEKTFYDQFTGVAIPLKILAPTVFMMSIIGVLRGFYQGKSTMIPTAFSQIIEQIVNAFVSVFAAYAFMKAHSANAERMEAWGAGGGTLGTTLGALFALLFLLFVYFLYRPTIIRQMKRDTSTNNESNRDVYNILLITIFPIILSQTVYNISGVIDDMMFGGILGWKGVSDTVITTASGLNSGKYRLLINVPIAISTSMASSMVPSIVASLTQGYYLEVHKKIQSSVKFNMIIAIPSAVGLTVLGEPVVRMLFKNTDYVTAGNLFKLGSVAIIFYALSTVTSGVLQSINKMRLPVIHSSISLGIHIVLMFVLLMFTDLGVYVLVIGNITYPILVCILNGRAVTEFLDYKQEIKRTFIIPLGCSVVMGVIIFLAYEGILAFISINTISVLLSILIGVVVYFVLMILTKGIIEEELYDFPFGRTMIGIGKKLHLL